MSDNKSVNRFSGEDGRRIEQRMTENQSENGHKERIVETHIEQIPLVLEERMIEKIVPVVTERRKEFYSEGKLVDTHVEQVEDSSLHLSPRKPVTTKEDIIDAVKSVLGEMPKKQHVVKAEEPSVPSKREEYIDWILYIILSGELAFIVCQLFLKNWL